MTGEESHWAFVGDSRIRQVYFEVLKLLDPDAEPSYVAKDNGVIYNNSQLSFQMLFFYRPILNQTTIDLIHQLGFSKSVPNLLVAGSGSWIIKTCNGSKLILENYSRNLRQVAEVTINREEQNLCIVCCLTFLH